MKPLNELIAQVLGIRIEPGHFKTAIKRASVSGKITNRSLEDMIIVLCEKIEEMETHTAFANDIPSPKKSQ